MPMPVQFIGQKQPSALAFLLNGIAQGRQQQQDAQVLRDVLGQQGALGMPGQSPAVPGQNMPAMPQGGQSGDPRQQLMQILMSPMPRELKSQLIDTLQKQQQIENQAASVRGESEVPPQIMAQLMSQIPPNADARQVAEYLLGQGVPQKQALAIAGKYNATDGQSKIINLNNQLNQAKTRLQTKVDRIMDNVDKVFNPFGVAEPDFTGEKGKKAIKDLQDARDLYIKEVKRLYTQEGLPIPLDVQADIDKMDQQIEQLQSGKDSNNSGRSQEDILNQLLPGR